ncbi:MAG: 2,3-bisphosphoglycerate-independent phosphoglycerate mutase [Porticoccaceae bacterium]
MTEAKKTTVLIVLDGWGHNESPDANAIYAAHSPVWDKLWSEQPHTLISGSGLDVGLPAGQMGNSEVGHMTLGAGRVVYQNFTRINKALKDGDFFTNPAYLSAFDKAAQTGNAVHLFGLLSTGGVHSHEKHIVAAIELAAQRGVKEIYLHAFLDGRDTPPRSAEPSLEKAAAKFTELGCGRIASICGRYYAMDRDQRWDRVQLAYQLITEGKADHQASNAIEGLQAAYQRGENDEFVLPTAIQAEGEADACVRDGDAIVFMNFRPDRARQLTRAFTDPDFDGFKRAVQPQLAAFVTTTEYAADIDALCAFAPGSLVNSLGDYLATQGKTQLRIAETEKYAHVTFFFSGGQEALYPGEDRVLIPSPDVATYDLKPEMSAFEVTEKLVSAIRKGQHDAIICNFANGDMVGHTGIFSAAVKAVETLDQCLGTIISALAEVGGQCLITADHGNVEQMLNYDSGEPLTSHTCEPVPLVYVGPRDIQLESSGSLADVAPTLLALMALTQPAEMTGHSLIAAAVSN